jgi:flagellar hook-associated protein 3 FlgL
MINSDYSLLSTLVGNSSSIRNQLAQVQEQVASGLVSDTYSGLGNQARTSLDLSPQIQHYATWQSNITSAQGRLDVTQSALTSINSIASNFFAQVNSLDTNNSGNVASLAQDATTALEQVANLVNSQSGDVYVFAGTDTGNPPLPSTDPSVLSSALLATNPSQAPFSTTLTSSVPEIQVGNNQWVKVGLLANANTLATSTQPTTGSYMRDIMTALAGLSQMTSGSNVSSAVATARGLLSSGISAETTEAGALGNIQSALTTQQTELSQTSTALTTQLSSVQNVDAASAITKATALQTQLQASYQIIAQSQSLSLASYIQP